MMHVEDEVAVDDPRVVVHDAHVDDPAYAFELSRIQAIDSRYAPMGVFRDVQRPVYDELMADQLDAAITRAQGSGQGTDDGALDALLAGTDTWQIA
jgi:2-oxoglutarate ferredoxin oxidoreductase subunit beta